MPLDEAVPAAPWTLHGEAIVGLKLLRRELVRSLLPPNTKLLSVWPGRVLAILYISEYRQSPVGEYREVIFALAIVRRGGRIGFWISHILVDLERSMLAGRAIWSLPKEMASIHWARGRVDVPELHLRVRFSAPRHAIPLPFGGAAIAGFHRAERWFAVRGSARIGITSASVEFNDDGVLGKAGLSGRWRMFVCSRMRLTIGRPVHL